MRRKLIEAVLSKLDEELAGILIAARAAHEAATHDESRPEDQYDTRGLEASYLAAAQGNRATDLERLIKMYRQLLEAADRPVTPTDRIGLGSLLRLELGGKRLLYFLVSEGGGINVQVDGQSVQVITPRAPLGEALQGRRPGDVVEVEIQGKVREYTVIEMLA